MRYYLGRAGRMPLLTAREEGRLARTLRDSSLPEAKRSAARDELVERNLRLVIPVAARYRDASSNLSLEDLVQEGNMGLIKAADKFDPDKGYKFSTYATWWIRQAVTRAIANKGSAIRVPVYLHERMRLVKKARADLHSAKQGREPTSSEVAERLGWDEERVRDTEEAVSVSYEPWSLDAPRFSADRPAYNAAAGMRPPSLERGSALDEPVGEEEPMAETGASAAASSSSSWTGAETTAIDLEEEPTSSSSLEEDGSAALARALSELSPQHRHVLSHRYGLKGDGPESTREIAALMGLSPQRVRQLQRSALRQLRRSPHLRGVAVRGAAVQPA